jgi:hypothetical protein
VLTDLDFTADFAGNAEPPSPGPAGVALSDAQQKRHVRFFMTSIRLGKPVAPTAFEERGIEHSARVPGTPMPQGQSELCDSRWRSTIRLTVM